MSSTKKILLIAEMPLNFTYYILGYLSKSIWFFVFSIEEVCFFFKFSMCLIGHGFERWKQSLMFALG